MELFGRLADGEAAVNFEYGSSAGFADVDFHGEPVSHGSTSIYPSWLRWPLARPDGIIRWRVSCTKETVAELPNRRSLQAELSWDRRERRIRKTNRGHENFKLWPEARMRIMLATNWRAPGS